MAAPRVAVADPSPDAPPAPFGRNEATAIIANVRKIRTLRGIDKLEAVQIGGIPQWTSIRGTDVRNPVLLYIHGGPGYVSMPMNWWFAQGWDEYFTVVHWDQRGAGKTYQLSPSAAIGPTLTLERMVSDAEEMVQWLRETLGKQKIFVLGHSWGSYLGLELAKRHPEWLHAYLGVGQLTDGPESERRGWTFAMDAARKDGNAQAIRDLNSVAPYSAPGRPPTLKEIYTQRKWLDYYGGVMARSRGNDAESDLSKLSPDYSAGEIAHIWDGNEFSEAHLLPKVLGLDLSTIRKLNCPLVIFAGRWDTNVNSYVAEQWFNAVMAPSKRFVWFENSAHLPMTEEPGMFLISLVQYVRPISG